MSKKFFVVLTLAVFLVGAVTSAYAISPVKLLLDGKEMKTDVLPKIVDGRLLVPVRIISEALGANVAWDEINNTVSIESAEIQSLKMQVQRLEKALAPADPLTAAKTWAEGVKSRNGALQYAVMSQELKNEHYQSFAESNWSTGVSSPWVENYQVTEKEKVDTGTYLYQIDFTYTDSTKSTFVTPEYITVKQYEHNWFISSINEKPDINGQITEVTNNGSTVSILVEDKTAKEPYDKAQVTITEDTKIYQGRTNELLPVSSLKEGATVEVVFSGPALFSYPVRVGAKTIRVLP